MALADEIISEAKKQGNVRSVDIEVGDLSSISAEEIRGCLEQLSDFKVNIIRKRAKVSCECGYTGEPEITHRTHDNIFFECPNCGSVPDVNAGSSIILKAVEVS